jgi:hypothetical protein
VHVTAAQFRHFADILRFALAVLAPVDAAFAEFPFFTESFFEFA